MLSLFFKLIYEASFTNLKNSKSSPLQKEADMIFCEREFVDWLRNRIGKKLTSETYPKYCTQKYFELFMPKFKKLKNKKEFKNKRDAIYQQLFQNSKFPPITKHEYDVDIVEAYFKIKKLLESQFTGEQFNSKKEYLNGFLYPIQFYCKENQMSFDRVMQSKYPIIINNGTYNFEAYLGRTLIACDIHKIKAILSYQNGLWQGEGIFPSFVEHLVYSFVFHNSLLENNGRLEKIMDWVEKNRTFIASEDSIKTIQFEKNETHLSTPIKKNLAKKIKNKTKNRRAKSEENIVHPKVAFGLTTIKMQSFEYWPYTEDKLDLLYKLLVEENKIEEIVTFSDLFKTFIEFPKNPIVWKTKNIELMYLLHLIYKKQAQFKSRTLQVIATKIFISLERNFNTQGLNTTLLQAKKYDEPGKKLTPRLKSIQDIVDKLDIR